MRTFFVFCSIVFLLACGGGGGGGGNDNNGNDIGANPDVSDSCAFNPEDFTNGANANKPDSYWNCLDSNNMAFNMALYDDGTGFSTAVGAFTWKETGCAKFSVTDAGGDAVVDNVKGSAVSGIVTFRQKDETQTITVSCVLVE